MGGGGEIQITGRFAGSLYENHPMVVRNEAKGKHELLLVQMSPKALKMKGNGDVNVSYLYNDIFYNT